jgi:quercetin dioxygenase-like cupin family protein
MQPVKRFKVLGDVVEVLVNGAMSNGASAVIVEEVRPGAGPPPHRHINEDETFIVLEGEFEVLGDGEWRSIAKGEAVYGPRGLIHTFRNSGETLGRLLIFIAPAGLENYLEEISPYSPGTDMAKILEISNRYGISFHLG